MPLGDEEESTLTCQTYGAAESAADLQTYQRLKRAVTIWVLLLAALLASLLLRWPYASFAVVVGGLLGLANMFLSMRGNERLVRNRSVAAFVLSSFLRLMLFGIVAAALVLRGPAWSLGPFLVGFFLPLVLYAISAPRAFVRK